MNEEVQRIEIDLSKKQVLVFSGTPPPSDSWCRQVYETLRRFMEDPTKCLCILVLPSGTEVELLKVDDSKVWVAQAIGSVEEKSLEPDPES